MVVGTDFPEIESGLAEYKKIDNRGDLNRKGEILCTLFKRLEQKNLSSKEPHIKAFVMTQLFFLIKSGLAIGWKKTELQARPL